MAFISQSSFLWQYVFVSDYLIFFLKSRYINTTKTGVKLQALIDLC